MSESEIARQKVDKYLQSLEAALRKFPREQASDIVEEIRSHIVDKATVGGDMTLAAVEAALATLGSPEELASQYVTDDLIARARVSRSPLLILDGLFRWASLSVAGFFVLIASLVGHLVGAAFVACAFLKPIHPHTAGLWAIPHPDQGDYELSLRLGFGTVPMGGRDLLGWWIVLLGLMVGFGLIFLTSRFGLWSIHRFRQTRPIKER